MNVIEFFLFSYFLDLCQLFRFNENCKQPNFKCVLLMTSQSLQHFIYKGCYMKFDLKQTCFIVLEQTGRPRVAYVVKHRNIF